MAPGQGLDALYRWESLRFFFWKVGVHIDTMLGASIAVQVIDFLFRHASGWESWVFPTPPTAGTIKKIHHTKCFEVQPQEKIKNAYGTSSFYFCWLLACPAIKQHARPTCPIQFMRTDSSSRINCRAVCAAAQNPLILFLAFLLAFPYLERAFPAISGMSQQSNGNKKGLMPVMNRLMAWIGWCWFSVAGVLLFLSCGASFIVG